MSYLENFTTTINTGEKKKKQDHCDLDVVSKSRRKELLELQSLKALPYQNLMTTTERNKAKRHKRWKQSERREEAKATTSAATADQISQKSSGEEDRSMEEGKVVDSKEEEIPFGMPIDEYEQMC